ncbi:UDP-glucuronosyltransferase 2B31-like [Glossophaga mutica]
MSIKWILVLLLLQLSCQFSPGDCGKVLVWPTEYSHWINMKIILDELVQRGHEVTVLTHAASILVDPNKQSAIKFQIYIILQHADCIQKICKDVVSNKKFMTKLQKSRFDVILTDAIGLCGELLAEILEIPVYSLHFSPGYAYKKYGGGLPLPLSYVPAIFSELSDKITFMERVKNMMYMLCSDFWFRTYNQQKWDQFYSDILAFQFPSATALSTSFLEEITRHHQFLAALHNLLSAPFSDATVRDICEKRY